MAEDTAREPEVLVSIQLRFPTHDSKALGERLAPVVAEALKCGGVGFNLGIQPYDPDGED